MMDFGSTFGSGSVDMQYAHLAFTYWMDFEEMKKNLLGFGFRTPLYRKATWPEYPEYQAVGRWEAELFDPEEWRNDYPNPAFVRMTSRDAFWAAKVIMRFTREELAAIVETGEFSRPDNAEYFLDVLIKRQHKCGRFGINGVNPLDEFRVDGDGLAFTNLSEKYGFMTGATNYRITWSVYDNQEDTVQPLRGPFIQSSTRLPLPDFDYYRAQKGLFLLAEIYSLNESHPEWDERIGVYLRPTDGGYEVVGIERVSP
jgi:hypothetical protein